MEKSFLLGAALAALAAAPAAAYDSVPLLDKLVQKNVLTSEEARQLEAGEGRGTEPLSWLARLKFHGDLRLRSEGVDNSAQAARQYRGRIRARAGAEAAVTEGWTVGLGLASGSSADSRSTNQTLTSNFSKKSLWLDYAYAEREAGGFAFYGGRMHNPLWASSDMLWDGDINPEGAAFRLASLAKTGFRPFAAAAWFQLDESTASVRDPSLAAAQAGLAWSGAGGLDFKAAFTYYSFGGLKGRGELANRPSTACGYIKANTLTGQVYRYSYDPVTFDLELNKDFAPLPVLKADYLGFFGGAVKATDHSAGSTGWIAGLKFGRREVEEAGQWQLRLSQRRLEADAWLDTYPDSDFYGGSTGVEGSEALLTLGVAHGMDVEADYYAARRISDVSKKERLLQLDLNLKF